MRVKQVIDSHIGASRCLVNQQKAASSNAGLDLRIVVLRPIKGISNKLIIDNLLSINRLLSVSSNYESQGSNLKKTAYQFSVITLLTNFSCWNSYVWSYQT